MEKTNFNNSKLEMVLPTDFVIMKKSFKKEIVDNYLIRISDGSVVLDFNAGPQGIYDEIDLDSVQYIALEQNCSIREDLSKKKLKVLDWNIKTIPLPDQTVDYVLSVPFIEHLPTYLDAMNLLTEVRRVLKPGGKILMVVPNYLNLKEIFFEDYKHGWITTEKRMRDMLGEAGFTIVDIRHTIGWITMKKNPITVLARFFIWVSFCILRFYPTTLFLRACHLDGFANKVKKTLFELIVLVAQV